MSLNHVNISGRLTRDSDLRFTPGGMGVASFSVAVNERRKNAAGEWADHASFIDCTMFGKRAESLNKYLTKGSKVAVEGKLRQSSWKASDGSNRSKIEVVVDEIELMSKGEAQPAQGGAPAYEEDIPF